VQSTQEILVPKFGVASSTLLHGVTTGQSPLDLLSNLLLFQIASSEIKIKSYAIKLNQIII
jgi:hypothetical protein